LAVLASAQSFAHGAEILVGGGLSSALELGRTALRPTLSLTAIAYAPVEATRDNVHASASVASFRAAPSLALFDFARFRLDAAVGGGVDVIHVTATALAPGVDVGPDAVLVDPVACANVIARVRLGDRTSVLLGLEGDVDLAARRYVVSNGTARDAALDLMPVRLALAAGFAYQVGGMERPR
jgi:hypothetical protein